MVAGRDLRSSYLASVQQNYELYVDILMRLHELELQKGLDALALQASERARARSLLDLLTEAGADIRQGSDPAVLERERSLQRRLSAKLERQMRFLRTKHTEEEALEPAREIRALTTEREQVEAQVRASSPRYAALTQPQPLSLVEIQRQVVDPDTVLLEYALGEERSFLWAVTPTTLTSHELPKRPEIEAAARRVYDLLTARNRRMPVETARGKRARIAHADREYPGAAAALSRMLLAPVAADLGKKRLLIVSDGALQYIPFAALPEPTCAVPGVDCVSLVVDHEIVSLPSASVLSVQRRELAGRRPAPRTVAVLADPVFESEDERVKGATALAKAGRPAAEVAQARQTGAREAVLLRSAADVGMKNGEKPEISRLPFTRREAVAILALVPPEQRKEALGFDASLATATSPDLANYRFVHFATHGFLDSVHPELSGLVLSLVDRGGREQAGFLSAADVFNLNLPVELVVLSGCQTALGKEVKGEGLVGLTRAFMYAGAPRVVASLWKVEDAATSELMARFYKGMLGPEKVRPAAALREAQVSMWKEKRWKMPYYWAAFVLQGEWK
jgi:CHAT domain-containing protein